jgi:hypothetical protein
MWFDSLTITGLLTLVTYLVLVYALTRDMLREREESAERRRARRFRPRGAPPYGSKMPI